MFLSVISNPKFNNVSIQCLSGISNPKLIIASVLPVSWLQYLTWAVKVQMPKMSLGRRIYYEIAFIIIIFHNWIDSILKNTSNFPSSPSIITIVVILSLHSWPVLLSLLALNVLIEYIYDIYMNYDNHPNPSIPYHKAS